MEEFLKNRPPIECDRDEEVFQNYIEDLELSPGDFDKKILDVGSGSSQFAKWAKEHYVSSEIYNLEPIQESQEAKRSVYGRAEAIPFKSETFDLVISNASIPNIFLGEKSKVLKEKIRNSLVEMIRVTKSGGEVRLGRVLRGESYKSQKEFSGVLDEALNNLRQNYNVEVEEIPYPVANTYEYINKKPVKILANAYLIKIHKPAKKE